MLLAVFNRIQSAGVAYSQYNQSGIPDGTLVDSN